MAVPSSLSFFSSSSLFLPSPSLPPNKPTHPLLPRCRPLTLRSELSELSPVPTATLPILSFNGSTVSSTPLLLRSAPPDTARAVVHRGLLTLLQNRRRGTASTLTRSEVRGGGRKPFPQKKLGRARRGSQRTPLRPGGGVVFGPKPKDWSIKMNRKEKRLALSTAIASAAAAEDAMVVEDFAAEFEGRPRTKEFVEAMRRWGLDPKEKVTFLMTEVPEGVRLCSRNIGTLKMLTPRTLNLFDILDAKKLVLTRSAADYLNAMYGAEEGDEVEWDEEGDEEEDDGNE